RAGLECFLQGWKLGWSVPHGLWCCDRDCPSQHLLVAPKLAWSTVVQTLRGGRIRSEVQSGSEAWYRSFELWLEADRAREHDFRSWRGGRPVRGQRERFRKTSLLAFRCLRHRTLRQLGKYVLQRNRCYPWLISYSRISASCFNVNPISSNPSSKQYR